MSTLDNILQRQVPVRTLAKMGGDAPGAEAGGGRADDAFSSVLSGQKRGTASARGQIDLKSEPDTTLDQASGSKADGPDASISAAKTQSDDMLSLLEGLMSGAAFSGETEFGADDAETAKLQPPESDETLTLDAVADVANPVMDVTNPVIKAPVQPQAEAEAVKNPDAAASANGGAQGEIDPSQTIAETHTDKPRKLDPVTTSEQPASVTTSEQPEPIRNTTQPAAAVVQTAVASQSAPASASVAAAHNGGSGRTGQGAQALAKPQPAATAPDQGKASGEDTEISRTLGTVEEPFAGSSSKKSGADGNLAGFGRKSAAARPAEEQMSAKTGPVEVVESRRFMPAQSLTGNVQMVARSLVEAGDAALATQRTAPAQSTAAAQPQSGQMLHTLKLQLNPVSLGSVTAVLKLTGEELSVSIRVETAEAYRQLSDDNQSILKAMRAQGYAVEQITVQHVPSGDRSGNAAQQGFQGNSQGPGSDDAQSSGRGNEGRNTGQQGANQHGGQGREQNPYPGSGSGRSDGVYL